MTNSIFPFLENPFCCLRTGRHTHQVLSHFIVSYQSIKIANDGYLVMLNNLGKGIGVDKLNIRGVIISTKW